ncbi:hypothetical protein ACFKI6_07885 [Streptococcus agalactiae]|uniref:hypothetical protein n=2 Tax=Streptococcus agalactiae TaxID=1311 RepID=UPI0002BAE09F|nr:hypothetical protein [Streptococcus agalactiae]MBR3054201.1 hypothetical protein [Streptococcus sp.]QBX07618.1 hypothetical protein JavanS16_0019 [Streptococcus satellite phage Javan16]AKI57061.1 Hypothetical Protein GBS85147_0632 [Streptococcus agalactiae]ASI65627.1 hypothetical protein GT95_03145 [Streptococcus agalactiae]EPT97305.1 hypothetical protein SAG0109_02405 [Streptococcus agalactiae BSU108]
MLVYHGTGLSNYEEILKTQQFIYQKKKNHWLGNGIYFFVEDFTRAKRWAEGNRPNKETEPVVIETNFYFESSELLDLDKSDDLSRLDAFARHFITELQRKRIQIRNMDEHEFHCKLLDAFIYKNKNYQGICRTMNSTGNSLAGVSKFVPLAKQLNIVNPSKIIIDNLKLHKLN